MIAFFEGTNPVVFFFTIAMVLKIVGDLIGED
jgi:hypothetical protein